MKILVGLGNPGKKYQGNRHNAGFRCIDYMAEIYSIPVKKRLCLSDTGRGPLGGNDVLLVKPRTFVNLSGEAASCLLQKFKARPEDLIVIHDDLDLPTGRLRLRLGGRSGGHRGVQSIIDNLSTQDFYRVRIGISRPTTMDGHVWDEDEIVAYVLGDFTPEEDALIQPAVLTAAEAVECILADGITAAMNKYNQAVQG